MSGANVTVDFDLDVPLGDYRIEFFTNPSGTDPTNHGEGEVFAGSVNVNHPGGGSQTFSHTFPGAVGDDITATTTTCTDGSCTAFLKTSEFSQFETAVGAVAVTSAVAEISPNDVTTSSTGNSFSYDIQATIAGADTGVNRVAITVPGSFGAPTVTDVQVNGGSVAYTDNTAGNDISVDLTVQVTTSSRITVLFDADAPGIQDLVRRGLPLHGGRLRDGPHRPVHHRGDGDGDAGDDNSWTVTTTDPPPRPLTASTRPGRVLHPRRHLDSRPLPAERWPLPTTRPSRGPPMPAATADECRLRDRHGGLVTASTVGISRSTTTNRRRRL